MIFIRKCAACRKIIFPWEKAGFKMLLEFEDGQKSILRFCHTCRMEILHEMKNRAGKGECLDGNTPA